MKYYENEELFNNIVNLKRLSDKEESYFYFQLINDLYLYKRNSLNYIIKFNKQ